MVFKEEDMYYNSSGLSRESSIANTSDIEKHLGSKVEISANEESCQGRVSCEQYTEHTNQEQDHLKNYQQTKKRN